MPRIFKYWYLFNRITTMRPEGVRRISYTSRKSIRTDAKSQACEVPVQGVVFDLDGTLTIPVLDFAKLRRELKCPHGVDILQYCDSKSGEEKATALKIVEDFEEEGRKNTQLQPGVFELLRFLAEKGLKRALITRNAQPSVDQFLELLGSPDSYGGPFTHVLTRDFTPTKPDPASLLHICKQWAVHPRNVVMVGDHIHDVTCGKDAGSVTILLNNTKNGAIKEHADFNVDSLNDIICLLTFQEMFCVERDSLSS